MYHKTYNLLGRWRVTNRLLDWRVRLSVRLSVRLYVNILLVNTIIQQILVALGPHFYHGCISEVSWLSLKMDDLDIYFIRILTNSSCNFSFYAQDRSVLVKFEDG